MVYIISKEILFLIIFVIVGHLPKSTIRSLRDILTEKASKPIITEDDKKFLQEFYKDDLKKLEQLLAQKLPWLQKNPN